MSLAPYRLPLSAGSSLWMYEPARDAAVAEGWNASYTGSTVWPPGGGTDIGAGSQFFRTQNAGASVSIDFTGTGLLLCFRDNGAPHTLSVDGRKVNPTSEENDSVCRELGATTTLRTGDLDFALHSVVLDVTASDDQEFQLYGGIVETSIAVDSDGETPTEIMIDDRDDDWIITRGGSLGWDIADDPRTYNGTISFICPYGSDMSAGYKFKGASAVVFYGRPSAGYHDFSIFLDQKLFSSDASVSGWTLPSTPGFFQAGLDADHEYTLTYRNFADGKNCTYLEDGTRRYCCSMIDGIKLIGSASKLAHFLPPSNPGTSSSGSQSSTNGGTSPTGSSGNQTSGSKSSKSSNTAAIAGGVVGGLVAAAAIITAAFFILRRRRHREENYRTHLPNNTPMRFSGIDASGNRPASSVAPGFVGSDIHNTVSPYTYSPPASSHTPSVISPITLMSGGPVMEKRSAQSHAALGSNSSSGGTSSQQVYPSLDLAAHAGAGTLPPAYTRG